MRPFGASSGRIHLHRRIPMKKLNFRRTGIMFLVLAALFMIAVMGIARSGNSISPQVFAASDMSGQWTAQFYKSGEIQLNFVLHSDKDSFSSFGETFAVSSLDGLASVDLMS